MIAWGLIGIALGGPPQGDSGAVLISGGGTEPGDGERALAKLQGAPWSTAIRFGQGYPRVERSSEVPGLNPGFHVVVLGFCSTRSAAEASNEALRLLFTANQEPTVPYVRSVERSRPVACPSVAGCRGLGPCELRCEAGEASACRSVGVLAGNERQHEVAYRANERACTLGDADGCYAAATALLDGRGVSGDPAEGLRRLEALCLGRDTEHPAACSRAGHAHRSGQGPSTSPERGQQLLERACELGDVNACCLVAPESCPT